MMKILLLVVTLYILRADSESCNTPGLVRLLWGSGNWEGNVQVCINDNWGWVCHNGFSSSDAKVVCNRLGFSTSGALATTSSRYGWGTGIIHMDYVNCIGTESSIVNCSYTTTLISNCNHNTLAGVICQSGGTCIANDIRLISTNYNARSQGRVEVCINNQWGTVCDYGWSSTDANVACRQLGFYRYYASAYSNAYYGQGYGTIHMSYVSCSSNSLTLQSCSYNNGYSYGCSHSDDAGARCYGRLTSSCSSGQLQLWRPYNTGPTNEGLAIYCRSGTWKGMCNYNLGCHTARVICQQLGYAGAVAMKSYSSYGWYYDYDQYQFSCSSSATTLSQCSQTQPGYYYYKSYYGYRFVPYCDRRERIGGFVCYAPIQGTTCTNGTVRLINGTIANEGRVEYCYEGEWVPFCAMSVATASVICNELGYNYSYASVFEDERFGRSNFLSSFNYKYCSSNQLPLSQCTEVRRGSACYITTSRCTIEYGLRCYNPGACSDDGEMKLVNGTIQQEGRIEICLNGVWGAICDNGWNTNDAYVFCREIGYNGQGPTAYLNAYFGEAINGPLIWSNIGCNGWETSIHNCIKDTLPNFNCTQRNTAGVLCKDACVNGDVKLLGGKYSNEGTVLVCYNNLWGLISDNGWSNGDAEVVCNKLGYHGGIADPILGSYYGKTNLIVHFRDVSCFGHESNIMQCSKTTLSFNEGRLAIASTNVAGVDCLYDQPTDCIKTPDWVNSNAGSECSPNYIVRLQGSQQQGTGRLEYCYNGYWSPFCKLNPVTASVVCKQLGFTNYSAASIIPTAKFGIVRNFSLFDNITCDGTESSISQCSRHTSECTPWCALSNIAITCFNPGICTNGQVRLMDGIIEDEGRVEICYNGVWGVICDQGWDTTDAHVICTQLGHPELEPVIFTNSSFGAGQYPIVYSNIACGGWEDVITDCPKQMYPQFNCSRNNVAGLLCGYDCSDGEVRLVGSEWNYEGTVEVCFNNIWGLIADSGWNTLDAEVVCRQLGYQTQGTIPYYGSHFGKPNKTIHLSSINCTGYEDTINHCTLSSLSLKDGKNILEGTNVAGVKCYTPDQCVPPPLQGTACTPGHIRLTGGQLMIPEGNLEYCYHGSWSLFCYLGPTEAIIACRQLGYTQYDVNVVFSDGRFGYFSFTSLFQNFTCENNPTAMSLSECNLIDSCRTSCDYPVGLRCYESSNCKEGAVRLVNGSTQQSGRLEVCTNNIWGSVCGDGFDVTDAHVVCRELGLGISEPTVYINSHFGDGNEAIVFSNMQCGGYEGSISDCDKMNYGTFSCSRSNVVGIICSDNCSDADVRLVFGHTPFEGTVEVCYYNTWGLISDVGWSNKEAEVICRQLNYNSSGVVGLTGSYYGKPNRNIHLADIACNGTEDTLEMCEGTLLTPDEVARLYRNNVAGVNCIPTNYTTSTTTIYSTTPSPSIDSPTKEFLLDSYVVDICLGVGLLVSIMIIISCTICLILQYYKAKKRKQNQLTMNMGSLADTPVEGVNPYSFVDDEVQADYETTDDKKAIYINE